MKILSLIKTAAVALPILLVSMSNVSAAILSFNPVVSSVETTDTFDVDVMISDLNTNPLEYVGVYDITVNYDSSILGLAGVTYDNYLDDGWMPSLQDDSLSVPGAANVAESSFLDAGLGDFVNQAAANGAFRLFTLTFDALAEGSSALTVDVSSYLGDDLGDAMAYQAEQGLVNVSKKVNPQSGVPEPGMFALFGIGLLGFVAARRRVS